MNNFNYEKEMLYGVKHLNKLTFDKKKYDFVKIIADHFNCELKTRKSYWVDLNSIFLQKKLNPEVMRSF